MSAGDSTVRGELALVGRLRALLMGPAEPPGGIEAGGVPFGDDMAALVAGTPPLLWTVDMLMDGVDFDSRTHSWPAIGRKAMAVNLSDCAAMGVQPVAALCAVALSNQLTMDNALALHRGAHELGQRYGCPIVGGDTNSWDAPSVISITVAARALPGLAPVCRHGARVGDAIWLTGPVGGSILGRHMTFEPRVELGQRIARELRPHAMIDISDGVALDLWRILEASRSGAIIDAAALDDLVHPDAQQLSLRDGRPAREHALEDGEDFELIVVGAPDGEVEAWRALGLRPLGRITAEPGLLLEHPDGRHTPIAVRGWEHFR